MAQEVNYSETTIDKIRRFLKEWDTASDFKFIFYGDPDDGIPTDSMPCMAVALEQTDIEQEATGMDQVKETIMVKVILSKKDYIDDFDDETVGWQKKLELLVQGADPVLGQYDETTLIGILRKQLTLGGYNVQNKLSAKYGEVARNGLEEDPTGEAHVRFIIERLVQTPGKI